MTAPAFVRDRTTGLLYAALGAFGALQTVPGLVAPALRTELDLGYGAAGLHVSAFAVGSVVAGVTGPGLDRRAGRRWLLLGGLAGMAAAWVLLVSAGTPVLTIAACGVAGLCGAWIIVAVQAGLSDHHGDRRAIAFSESNVMASVGATAAPLAIGALAALTGSWRTGVLALAATGLAVAVLGRTTRVPAHVPATPLQDAATPTRGLPTAARAGVAVVFCGVVLEWSVGYWGATYLRDVVGLARPTAVTAMVCFFVAMLVGRALGGWLVRRIDPVPLVAAALTAGALGVLVHAASTSAAAALPGLVLLGLGASVLFPLGLSLAVQGSPGQATVVSGRCVVGGSAAVLVGPLAVGQLADAVGLRPALLVLPAAVAGAALALVVVVRTRT